MKRVLIGLAVVTMVIGLAGCGDTNTEVKNEDTTQLEVTQQLTETDTNEEPEKVTEIENDADEVTEEVAGDAIEEPAKTWLEEKEIEVSELGPVEFDTLTYSDKKYGTTTMKGTTSSSTEVDGDNKTITFQFSFEDNDTAGWSFSAEVIDAYTGKLHQFENIEGAAVMTSEVNIEYDGKNYLVNITIDFNPQNNTLIYTVNCPKDYEGTLITIGEATVNSYEYNAESERNFEDTFEYKECNLYYYLLK